MKKTLFKLVAMFVTLVAINVSCQNGEDEIEPTQKIDITYWIDGDEASKSFTSQEEKRTFLKSLINLTIQGRIVSFEDHSNSSTSSKGNDRQTLETTDKAEIENWSIEMGENQYNVTVVYNKETGTYTGIATKVTELDLISGKVWVCNDQDTIGHENGCPVLAGECAIMEFISKSEGGVYVCKTTDNQGENADYSATIFSYVINGSSGRIIIVELGDNYQTFNMPFAIINETLYVNGPDNDVFIFECRGNRENYDYTTDFGQMGTDLVSGKVWEYKEVEIVENENGDSVEIGEVLLLDFISPTEGGRLMAIGKDYDVVEPYEIKEFVYTVFDNYGILRGVMEHNGSLYVTVFFVDNGVLYLGEDDGNIIEFVDKGNRENYDFSIYN